MNGKFKNVILAQSTKLDIAACLQYAPEPEEVDSSAGVGMDLPAR